MRSGHVHPSLADYHQAIDLMSQSRFQDAVLALRRGLKSDPDFLDARFQLAKALRSAGHFSEAWKEIRLCLSGSTDDAGILEEAADLAILAGKGRQAAQILAQLQEKRPSDLAVRQRLVAISFMWNGPKAALQTVTRLLRDHPKWAGGHRALGHLFESEGQISRAEDAYSKAIEIDPNESQILEDLRRLWRGFTFEENPFRLDMAALHLVEARRLVSAGVSTHALTWLEKWADQFKEEPALAEAFAEGCRELGEESPENPTCPQTSRAKIQSLIQAGQISDAGEAVDQAVHQFPEDPELWFLRAFLARETGFPEETILSLERAVSLAPRHRESLFALGVERLKAGMVDEAVPPLGDLCLLDPENVEAWRHLAIAHTKGQRWDEAAESWSRVLDLSPEDAQAARNLSQIERFLGRLGTAPASGKGTKV